MTLFDSHCHLTSEQFDADRDAVIQRALDAGVTHMLTLATDVTSSRAVIGLAERYVNIYAAVGIHPESVRAATLDELKIIRELAAHPRVVALGEIGLDYYWDKTTADLQQDFFERQLELAAELNLPVAIHDRDAHAKIIETLETFAIRDRRYATRDTRTAIREPRGVLHAFSGSVEMAQQAFALGFFVSFGGPVTFKNNKQAPELLRALPLEKILIETDSPYLAPHPLRGKRNEPAHVRFIAQRLAEGKGLSIEQAAARTAQNAKLLFRL
ncbi:MAG: TatD family hydrolase [Anaerolineales bacterium]|nr:TatD family hydrolase [Anaerolineales bacterium]